jgi:hypothetical protein
MFDALLFTLVAGAMVLALGVDVAMVLAWLAHEFTRGERP